MYCLSRAPGWMVARFDKGTRFQLAAAARIRINNRDHAVLGVAHGIGLVGAALGFRGIGLLNRPCATSGEWW